MDLAFTDLQDELRAQARGFLEATPEPSGPGIPVFISVVSER